MHHRLTLWLALALVSCSLIGCGGGGLQEGAPAEDPGYVDPGDAAE